MKRKDRYYNNNPYYNEITIDEWFEQKDHCFKLWQGHSTIKELFGINLQPKRRHRRSFISCRLPKVVGNRVVYRLFKATRWFKEPNTKHRRDEKYYE